MVIGKIQFVLAMALCCSLSLAGEPSAAMEQSSAEQSVQQSAKPAPQAQPEMATVAYLGIHAQYVSAPLRSQLDLAEGVGLIVDFVEEAGPAAKAGLNQHDIIEKFNDQLLVSPFQMKVLVRNAQPGQKVKLTILRKAKRVQLDVVMGRQQVSPRSFALVPPDVQMAHARGGASPVNTMALNRVLDQPGQALMISARQMSFTDGQHKIVVRDDQNGRHLRATNQEGDVLYDGYVNTADQQAAVPEDVQRKMERLEDIQRRNNIPVQVQGEVQQLEQQENPSSK